jgi:ParB/RepB/Spo0J family partition protein
MQPEELLLDVHMCALSEAPSQYRKTYNEATIVDLATSMQAMGLQQRIKVRALGMGNGYEVVFGHRRYRAAQRLGWTHMPAVAVEMTDAQVEAAQIAENLHREDVNAIDEADGFAALMERHGCTAEQIAEQTGRSRTTVYNRLKLRSACQAVRQAVIAGTLDAEVACLLARLPSVDSQEAQLAHVQRGRMTRLDDGEWVTEPYSFRHVRTMLAQLYRPLKKAPFDRADATLTEAGACGPCPYRSGNKPEIMAEAGADADTCTSVDCYRDKVDTHNARLTASVKAAGAKESKVSAWEVKDQVKAGSLIDLDSKDPAIDKKRTLREVLGAHLDMAQVVQEGSSGAPLVVMTPDAMQKAMKAAGITATSTVIEKAKAKRTETEAKHPKGPSKEDVERVQAERMAIVHACAQAFDTATHSLVLEALRFAVHQVREFADAIYDDESAFMTAIRLPPTESAADLQQLIDTASTPSTLMKLLVFFAVGTGELYPRSWSLKSPPQDLHRLCKVLQVDPAAAVAAAQPATEAAAKPKRKTKTTTTAELEAA